MLTRDAVNYRASQVNTLYRKVIKYLLGDLIVKEIDPIARERVVKLTINRLINKGYIIPGDLSDLPLLSQTERDTKETRGENGD